MTFQLDPSGDERSDQLDSSDNERSGLEPELGGSLREKSDRTGLEPELGGDFRQRGVYVDEVACVGCMYCVLIARNTFYVEPEHGRARVIRQDGDPEELIEEAIDSCPVDCIHWLDYTELEKREEERCDQVIPIPGFPVNQAMARRRRRKEKE
ncbi:MAG: ferredoxin [Symploca sp. SIO2G7]|nr:ferredoxin [Symploca sp. SIO2G7]